MSGGEDAGVQREVAADGGLRRCEASLTAGGKFQGDSATSPLPHHEDAWPQTGPRELNFTLRDHRGLLKG